MRELWRLRPAGGIAPAAGSPAMRLAPVASEAALQPPRSAAVRLLAAPSPLAGMVAAKNELAATAQTLIAQALKASGRANEKQVRRSLETFNVHVHARLHLHLGQVAATETPWLVLPEMLCAWRTGYLQCYETLAVRRCCRGRPGAAFAFVSTRSAFTAELERRIFHITTYKGCVLIQNLRNRGNFNTGDFGVDLLGIFAGVIRPIFLRGGSWTCALVFCFAVVSEVMGRRLRRSIGRALANIFLLAEPSMLLHLNSRLQKSNKQQLLFGPHFDQLACLRFIVARPSAAPHART